ncbi:hypothetical protein GGR21_001852 [Dysgonomonas hofstadii]|uniref:Uncharacterized protein n=2 Tax=Dysgonomonas hofstadii TaxID=637886 RepID=A0A840CIT4_9BACT|nr:hypothetical protein [Dysgonomonas hofstadii]MBB4035957.1 hypothetical protein [Dysgonomonas hofstadii]
MNRVLLLFSYDDWDEIYPISRELESKGKTVLLWTVEPKKKSENNTVFPQNVRVVSTRESSKINGLSTSVVEEFEKLSYDTLIDLTSSASSILLYLLAGNKSEFCIGIKESDYKMYDFAVLRQDNMTVSDAYEQIKYYLNNIN